MFENVLVALDFSEHSQKNLEYICEIPGVKVVTLLHVVDATHPSVHGWTHGPHIENAKLLMNEKKGYLEELGRTIPLRVNVIVDAITQGSIPGRIIDIAQIHNASLIVTGSRGMNPIKELLLGSVSSAVLRNAPVSVLIMRHAGTRPADKRPLFSTVLVPTDFSKPADDVVSSLRILKGIDGIVLLHVVGHTDSQGRIEEDISNAKSLLETIKEGFSSGITITRHVRVGDPTEMILSVAEEDDVSLVAMSAFGTGWLRTMLLGSTTFTVARSTKKPILILRDKQDREEI